MGPFAGGVRPAQNGGVLLHEIAETSRAVASTRARLLKVERLAACLGSMEPAELPVGVAFLSGELTQGRIGVSYAVVREASPGAVAASPSLVVIEVDRELGRIAGVSGRGSKAERLRLLRELLGRATAVEQPFLQRLIVGELRQGALEGIMIEAIARVAEVPSAEVRRAVMVSGNPGAVAQAARTHGSAGLSRFSLELFRPVQPMLAQTAEGVEEAVAKTGPAALEFKLDGVRVQLHRQEDEVRVFTRKLKDITERVPELVEAALRLPSRALVLDGEAIALRSDGSPHPFQVTMRRLGRKLDVARMRETLPLTPVFFDVLHVDGQDLIDRGAEDRFGALADALPAKLRVRRCVTGDVSEAEAFLDEALGRGHEGIMAKSLAAPYEAGRRGAGWLKIKPAHTLDLMVLAAEWGSGRRRGWLSNLHLGARDAASGGFVMLGKTFKGMTDELLAWQTKRLQEIERERDQWTVHVRPELVIEVAFDGVQESPHYPGGLALRFARVKRYRPDKRPEEVDTIDTVRAIHAGQLRAGRPS